jgi:L-lactate dehydrogenase complex protein LldE
MADLFLPEIGEATILLLRRLGLDPVYHKEQTCCGQPLFNAGYRKRAKQAAKHFIEVFGDDDVVVCPSGSCVHMVKHSYPKLLAEEAQWDARARRLAPRVFELSQYIVDELGIEDVGATFEGKVTYHESCRLLRGLGVSEQPRKLLRSARGAEFVEMDNAKMCCGFGGEFANDYPEISGAMVEEKAASYLASGADVLVACEPGCLLNIGGYLSRHHPEKKVVHLATFLADTPGKDG